VCCSAEAGGGGSGTAVRSATLATMYEPPKEMLFCGTFVEAKQAAQRDGRWLVRKGRSGVACCIGERCVWLSGFV
jgi:hypothetical protein